MTGHSFHSEKGFSLIELMIVVVIIGILAAVAVPSYLSHVRKTSQADGIHRLMDIKTAQEKYYALNDAYCCNPPGGTFNLVNADTTFRGMVNFNVTDTSMFSFTISSPNGFTLDYLVLSENDINGDGTRRDCWEIDPNITRPSDRPMVDGDSNCTVNGEDINISLF